MLNFIELYYKKYGKLSILIIGDGKERKKMKKIIMNNYFNVNVNFLGHINNVDKYICLSKILLLPTLNEGMPNVVLEAGINGVVSVVSNFDGSDEIIKTGIDGYIFNNVSEAVDMVNQLLLNNNKREVMGKKMKNKVLEKFYFDTQKKYIDCLLS